MRCNPEMASKEYNPKPTIPVKLMVIYDERNYEAEIKERGKLVRTTFGNFSEEERAQTNLRVSRLTEVVLDFLQYITANGCRNLEKYTVHVTFQPILAANAQNVITEGQNEYSLRH